MNHSPDPSTGIVVGFFLLYGFFILLALASFVFWIVEIIDVARREFKDPNTKLLWLLVVILAHGLGALIYYFVGKPQGWLPGQNPQYSPQYPATGQTSGQWPPPPGASYGQNSNPQTPPENRQE